MKKIIRYGIMYIIVIVVTIMCLDLANDYGSYWINIAWVTGIWYGIETMLLYQIVLEWKNKKR